MNAKNTTSDNTLGDGASPDYRLLSRCLTFSGDTQSLQKLRIELLSNLEIWERLYAGAKTVRLAPSVYARLENRGLLPPKRRGADESKYSPAQILETLDGHNRVLRRQQTETLEELVASLNAKQIDPVLIKGARTLWLGVSPWRTMRDLDILVAADEIDRAQDTVIAQGFLSDPEEALRPNRHHKPPLFRPELNFYIELHQRAGNRYAEQFFPTSRLLLRGKLHERNGLRAYVLGDGDEVWQNLVHHFFGHSGFARGTLDYKGLYEFASAFQELGSADRTILLDHARRCSMGLAALDLWVAAAHDELGIALPPDVQLHSDAIEVWLTFRAWRDDQSVVTSKYPGYRPMWRLALASKRTAIVSRASAQNTLVVRAKAIAKLLPKISRTGPI